ncbi:MAG: hypothetical protein M3162_09160 [Thermoproteota archaeon]|nr:hypothetical protein [Thermoproteota archaeon]
MRTFTGKAGACKIYTRKNDGQWKMIALTGLLDYRGKSSGSCFISESNTGLALPVFT